MEDLIVSGNGPTNQGTDMQSYWAVCGQLKSNPQLSIFIIFQNEFFKKNQESNDDKTITTVIVKVKVAFSISGHCERESLETNELSLFQL